MIASLSRAKRIPPLKSLLAGLDDERRSARGSVGIREALLEWAAGARWKGYEVKVERHAAPVKVDG